MTVADPLADVVRASSAVLLDFDGPVTQLLPGATNLDLANAAREPLLRAGIRLPCEVADTSDHLRVLRFAGSQGHSISAAVGEVSAAGEMIAAVRSVPTPGGHELLLALDAAKRPVVIVSNNTAAAIEAYLARHDLQRLVLAVIGRPAGAPELMKPHPAIVLRGLQTLDVAPRDALMVGDSVTDIEVSRRIGMPVIGYAKTDRRATQLAQAGADLVVRSMTPLADAVWAVTNAA